MKTGEREEFIFRLVRDELIPILRRKGHDYSGDDVHSNFRDFGWEGVIVRIGDKYHRLKTFILQRVLQVEDETIEDTLKDLINYGFIALLLYRESKAQQAISHSDEE